VSKTKSKNTNRRARVTSRRRASRGLHPLVLVAIAVGVVGSILGINLWRSGAFVRAPAPSRDESPAGVPLSQAGSLIEGGHDMSLLPAQTPAPRQVAPGQPVPRLTLSSVVHDFGRIYSSWDVTHVFVVQNTGDADLEIDNLVTSCGCTTARLSSDVIPPGQSAELSVTFDADYHPTEGEVTRLVWFATNDPTQPWVEVRLTADVRA